MIETLQENPWILAISGGFSLFLFLTTAVTVPWILVRLPHDYFTDRSRKAAPWRRTHPATSLLLAAGRNILGYFLLLIGLVMLVIPGQGLLTIVVGLTLCTYPGKYRLERWAVTRPRVWRTINWLRRRAHAPELAYPEAANVTHEPAHTRAVRAIRKKQA